LNGPLTSGHLDDAVTDGDDLVVGAHVDAELDQLKLCPRRQVRERPAKTASHARAR
jgi:hypothetical protein